MCFEKKAIRSLFFIKILISFLQYNFNNKGYLCFDTITLVPIQTKLLDPSLLTIEEVSF